MFKKIQGMSLVLHIGFSKPMLHIVGQSETMLHRQAPLDGFILTAPGISFLLIRLVLLAQNLLFGLLALLNAKLAFSGSFCVAKLAVLVETFFVKKVLPQAPFHKTLLNFS